MFFPLHLWQPQGEATPSVEFVLAPLDVEIELYNPDWTLSRRVDQFDGFELEEREDGTAVCKFTMPLEDVPTDIYATGGQQCPIVVYIRGTRRFGVVGGAGIISSMEDEDREGGGSSLDDIVVDVHIEAITDWQYHLMGREVKGTSGNRYSRTSMAPTVAMRDLINANCRTGSVIEPTEYATLGTSGVDRDNFGAHKVLGAYSGSHPDTIDSIRWPNGESLFHSIVEGCRRHDCRVASSWNTAASPPEMTVTITYPRLGSDLTSGSSQVRFSRETGSLAYFSRKVDHLKDSNVAEVQGKSVRANQPKGYAIHQDSYDAQGLRETGDLWPDGWQDDVDEEAAFIMAQVGGSSTTYEAKLREITGMVLGEDCDLGDKIAIDDSRRGISVEDYITTIKWSMSGAGPLNPEILLGREEISDSSRGGRSGGGRSGSGRKGGKPKGKGGEPESARTIETNAGDVVFDQADDTWLLKGETGVTRIRPVHALVDDPDTEDGDEETKLYIEGDVFEPCVACNGYMWIWAANLGRNVKVLITDPGPGGGAAAGPDPAG